MDTITPTHSKYWIHTQCEQGHHTDCPFTNSAHRAEHPDEACQCRCHLNAQLNRNQKTNEPAAASLLA